MSREEKMSRPRYFTPSEVAAHNSATDCWLSYLGSVYDLTPLCRAHKGDILLKPIVANAGKDISHWFNPETRDLKTHVHPVTGCLAPYTPVGRFIHVPPPCPRSDWANNFGKPWWKDEKYCIGFLSKQTRRVRIVNTLTLQEQAVEVCEEEVMTEVLSRYLPYNSHAGSYTWKFFGKNLEMEKTLAENGIANENSAFFDLRMDQDEFLPPISLYFNDDLTEA